MEVNTQKESNWPLYLAGCAFIGLLGSALVVAGAAVMVMQRSKNETPVAAVPQISAEGAPILGDGDVVIGTLATPAPGLTLVYASVKQTAGQPPARYRAPFPTRAQAGTWRTKAGQKLPPQNYVVDQLCGGDEDMHRRFQGRLRAEARDGATAEEIDAAYGGLMRYCPRSGKQCAQAKRLLGAGDMPVATQGPYWQALQQCRDPQVETLMTSGDAPPLAIVRWHDRQRWAVYPAQPPTYSENLARAVEAVVTEGPAPDHRVAAFLLADTQDPRAVDRLVALHGTLTDKDRRNGVAAAFSRADDHPGAAKIFAQFCKRKPNDPVCRPGARRAPTATPPQDPSMGLLERTSNSQVNLLEVVEENVETNREYLLVALQMCTHESLYNHRKMHCLRELARLDWGLAARQASFMRLNSPDQREALAAITRYPDALEYENEMSAWGLLGSDWPERKKNAASVPFEPRDLLQLAGTAYTFDVETGMFPNEHDSLLRTLAGRAPAGAFAGVLFEETAPEMDSGAPYVLTAYADGKTFSTTAKDHGDWYDLDATIGLLNVLARERKADARFVVLGSGDQMATVVVAPEDGLRQAVAAGLLWVGTSSSEAMDSGKAFEKQVFDSLQKGELDAN